MPLSRTEIFHPSSSRSEETCTRGGLAPRNFTGVAEQILKQSTELGVVGHQHRQRIVGNHRPTVGNGKLQIDEDPSRESLHKLVSSNGFSCIPTLE